MGWSETANRVDNEHGGLNSSVYAKEKHLADKAVEIIKKEREREVGGETLGICLGFV